MAAYRKEQMLRLLDDLDADMEANKPIHWTVRKPCQMNKNHFTLHFSAHFVADMAQLYLPSLVRPQHCFLEGNEHRHSLR